MATGKEHAPRSGRGRSQRQLRVGELIRHALVDALARGGLHDPDLVGTSITVTEVRVSPDLRNATAFVMPLGGTKMTETVAALNRAAPFLRHAVGHAVTMRYLPHISFVADTAFEQGQRIDDLLRSPAVARDLAEPHAGTDPASDDGSADGT